MSLSPALRHARRGVGDYVRERARSVPADVNRYRLDPWKHLEDGHVLIAGLAALGDEAAFESETGTLLRPMLFEPYQHEIDLGAEWIDLDRLARTGRAHPELAELRWRNLLVEKSRAMGFTWTVSYLLLWALVYWPDSIGFAHNINAAKVDDGGDRSTTESIFGRIRYMAESRRPDGSSTWPDTYYPRDLLTFHQAPLRMVRNAVSGARLVGGAATEDPGRGGQYTHALLDEFAFVPWGGSVHKAISQTCRSGRLYGSTAKGKGNRFYELIEQRPRGYRRMSLHWRLHPVYAAGSHVAGERLDCPLCDAVRAKVDWNAEDPVTHRYPGRLTSPWYDAAVIELTDEEVASELDISYEGSLTARVYPEFDAARHVLPEIPFDPRYPVEFSFDYGWSPSFTSVGIWQDRPEALVKVGEVEISEATPEDVANLVRDELANLGMTLVATEPRFTATYLAIGDPSGEARSVLSGRSLVEEYALQGFSIIPGEMHVGPTIRAYKRLLQGQPKPVRYSAATCPRTIRHLEQNRWKTDRSGVVKQPPRISNDEHNHMCLDAGTLVETRRGAIPIERVRAGDYALTRVGWRRVKWAGPTGWRPTLRARWDSGHMDGTADHPIWVRGEGWVPLGDLDDSMRLVVGEAPEQDGVVSGVGERGVAAVAEKSADPAGRVVVVDVEAGHPVVVGASIGRAAAGEATATLPVDHRVVFGERDSVLPAEPVVAALRATVARVGRLGGGSEAVSAAEAARRVTPIPLTIGAANRDAAIGASRRSELPSVRVAHVVSVERPAVSRRRRVYSVSVEGQPEFFANGALVHNTRADGYYVCWKFPPPEVDETVGAAAEAFSSPSMYRRVESYDEVDPAPSIDPEFRW